MSWPRLRHPLNWPWYAPSMPLTTDRSMKDLRYEVEQIQELFERGEAIEGLRAFIDKRAPEFV